jgi:hypothetical protein
MLRKRLITGLLEREKIKDGRKRRLERNNLEIKMGKGETVLMARRNG